MRLLGSEPRRARGLVPWLVMLIVFTVLAAATYWGRQQETARQTAEGQLATARVELAAAQASLTAIVEAQARASASAVAPDGDASAALRRALDLVFAAYKEPSDQRLKAVADAFSPAAMLIERPEAEHLISAGTHLGGVSAYELTVLSSRQKSAEEVEIRTRESWTYDERDDQDRRTRCVREDGEQTYTLRRVGLGWLVTDIQLGGSRRSECT